MKSEKNCMDNHNFINLRIIIKEVLKIITVIFMPRCDNFNFISSTKRRGGNAFRLMKLLEDYHRDIFHINLRSRVDYLTCDLYKYC